MAKRVCELVEGDVIDPPAGERGWLWKDGTKRRYTVVRVADGKITKAGRFLRVFAKCPSPYRNEELFEINCDMLENKKVTVHN